MASATPSPSARPNRSARRSPPSTKQAWVDIVYPEGGLGLRHCPSGKFAANAAWLLIATLAHNLLRWVAAIGLGVRQELVVAKTLRRTLLNSPGRLTRSARRLILPCPPAGTHDSRPIRVSVSLPGRRPVSWLQPHDRLRPGVLGGASDPASGMQAAS